MALLENKFQKANRVLQDVIAATVAGNPGYLFTDASVYDILEKKGFVEVNHDIKNDAGEFATRATQKGLTMAKPKEMEESVPMSENKFEIGDVPADFSIPVAKRGGNGGPHGSKYPFAALEVGKSFFVADGDIKGGNAAKTMIQACSKANKAFGEPAVNADGTPKMRTTRTGQVQATKFIRLFQSGPYTKGEVSGALVVRKA